MLFFNNRRILHGREAFADDEARCTTPSRHFLRLWLEDKELAGQSPEGLQDIWRQVFPGHLAQGQEYCLKWRAEPQQERRSFPI